MAHDPTGSAKTLIVVGPQNKFYAIPMHDLERFAHDLNTQKQTDLDRLVSESIRNGRHTLAFYHDRVVAQDSAALKP